LAKALNNLCGIYGERGRLQEALSTAEEAEKLFRELVTTNPVYRGDLAKALYNRGIRYSELGRRQEALASTEEAVKIYRELAKINQAFLGDLAMALNNLGVRYGGMGRPQEALAPTEEAVKIYRELAKIKQAFLGDLAMALNNLGVSYSKLGRKQEALAPTEEAVKVYRVLAKTNPAFLGDLASSLNNLGYFQLELGQPEIARSAYEEALKLYRPMAASNSVFQEDLQRTQNNLDELNRNEGIRTGAKKPLEATNVSYMLQGDPLTPVKRSVVRLWPTFAGKKAGIGLLGTGFVLRREGDRAWIATALHVVRDPDDYGIATKVEAELFTGPLPPGRVRPRLEVVRVQVPAGVETGEDLIVLELRGLPPDVQPLPLSLVPPQGPLTVVGHPTDNDPWTVGSYQLLKATPILLLDGRLEEGASGSPVLTPAGQVAGLVYRSSGKGEPVPLMYAYPARSIQGKLP
jgi:Flp pilus assembly protein TadD